MICDVCAEPARETIPTGEYACTVCLQEYWNRVLEEEGLSSNSIHEVFTP